MTKGEMIILIADNTGMNKATASDALDTVLNAIITSVANGEKVTFVGFGTFERKVLAARNRLTPPTRVPSFKPGKAFTDAVANE